MSSAPSTILRHWPGFVIVGRLMPTLSLDSMKRWIFIIAASAMLAPQNAEIIDYHQYLYSPEAGARSSPGPTGMNAGCVANRAVQTGQTKFVFFETLYLWAFQRCRTRSEQLKNCICNTDLSQTR
jgi:hypothetical protein